MNKNINEMTYNELVAEIQYIASLLNDQPHHHDAYLLDLVDALNKKTIAYMTGTAAEENGEQA